jgi:hypothetical protein
MSRLYLLLEKVRHLHLRSHVPLVLLVLLEEQTTALLCTKELHRILCEEEQTLEQTLEKTYHLEKVRRLYP